MFNAMNTAGAFLITTIFDSYLMVLLVRVIFQYRKINFYNPISQFIYQVTAPVVKPLQRILPTVSGIDTAVIFAGLLLGIIKFALLFSLSQNAFPGPVSLVLLSVASMLDQFISIFFWAILLSIVLSWVGPMLNQSPLQSILFQITEPLLSPVRRVLPLVGGVDLSPIPVMLGLRLLAILSVQPLYQLAL